MLLLSLQSLTRLEAPPADSPSGSRKASHQLDVSQQAVSQSEKDA